MLLSEFLIRVKYWVDGYITLFSVAGPGTHLVMEFPIAIVCDLGIKLCLSGPGF